MHISCNNKRDRRGIFVEKVWLDQYLPGVPAEVDPDTYDSLVDVFDQSVEKYRKRPAYISMGQTLSYAQLDEACRDFAAYLQGKLGLQKGARVAIMMPNILQYPVALFGVLRAGLTVVNVNPLYTPRELSHQLKDSGAEAIVILSNFANTLEQVVADTPVRHVVVTDLGDMLPFPKRLIYFPKSFLTTLPSIVTLLWIILRSVLIHNCLVNQLFVEKRSQVFLFF